MSAKAEHSEEILDPGAARREIIVYSYYRDAELRGSNLLYRLLRILNDGEAQVNLTQHLADETRHAWLWTERIREIGGVPLPIEDGYQVRIGKRVGVPRDVIDLLALTVVVEQRSLRRYRQHLRRPGVPPRTQEVLRAVSKDEVWHVDWIRSKARELAVREGGVGRVDDALRRYREVDRAVMAELAEVEQSLVDGPVL
ncbi:MAG TPA: ferritin-like domain-containing protein [Myxococcota bacterium]|nr:ferritin-like domain-containing protein [Myxococcota bacterium]